MNYREKFYIKYLADCPDLLTTKDLSKIMGINCNTVSRRLIPEIKHIKSENCYFIPKVFFLQYILNNEIANKAFDVQYLQGFNPSILEEYKMYYPEVSDVVDATVMRKLLNLSKYSAYKRLHEYKIEHFMIGTHYRIPKFFIFLHQKFS